MELAVARAGLDAQPFNRLLGARLVEFGDGRAVLELEIRTELQQQNGFLHGGVLSYAADNALTFAAAGVLGAEVLTSGFTIDYLRPATGRLLRAEADVVRAGRRGASCRCDLYTVDTERRLCAIAQGSVAVAGAPVVHG